MHLSYGLRCCLRTGPYLAGYAILHFLMEESLTNGTKVVVPGVDVVTALEAKLKASQDILDLKVLEMDTLECQNTCSGHGKCQQATRTCICEPFWIENFVRRHLMDGKSNCGKKFILRTRHFPERQFIYHKVII